MLKNVVVLYIAIQAQPPSVFNYSEMILNHKVFSGSFVLRSRCVGNKIACNMYFSTDRSKILNRTMNYGVQHVTIWTIESNSSIRCRPVNEIIGSNGSVRFNVTIWSS